jgi:hypothetical protein
MPFTAWHYEIDTLPHFSVPRTDASNAVVTTLRIPLGIWSNPADAYNVVAEISVNGGPPFRIGFDVTNPNGHVRAITRDTIAWDRGSDRKLARWYLEMESRFAAGNQYYEAIVETVPVDAKVQYLLKVLPRDQASRQLGPYVVYATFPEFAADDIFFMSDGGGRIDDGCALYYTFDPDFHYFRADFVDVSTSRLDYALEVDEVRFSLADTPFAPENLPSLPEIDPFGDSVIITVPRALVNDPPAVRWRGAALDITQRTNVGAARVMFIHYCMQGLNDLFELPNKGYSPPRTYMETTMRDERATYSSRPNSREGTVPDGYAFTLEAHRVQNIPYLWTFNGGVLALIAHDCAADLTQMRQDIAAGRMDPTIAGFGGHRLPYYQKETNLYSIQLGIEIVENILGACNRVYYLDQRLYKQSPNVMDALVGAGVQYIVIDGSTGFYPYRDTTQPNANAGTAFLDDQYLWRDQRIGLYLLYITDELREKMVGSSDFELDRGKLAIDLRRKFLYFAANPVVRARNLLIYSDDADKASGNGWFDGDYSGTELNFKDKYHAGLEWIARHPWIRAVTSADLNPSQDCVGTIDMQTAVCPSVDPGGVTTTDVYGKRLHFDAWYDNWKAFPAIWLGQSLEEVSQAVEYAIIDWPAAYRNELYALAQMQFSMYLHESQWNKQPLESIGGRNPNERADVVEPEDFVIAASLQARNAQVFLNAALWASWVPTAADHTTHINDGPVIDLIGQVKYTSASSRDNRYRSSLILEDALRWDRDPLQSIVVYNDQVLLVLDRNGGRVTHIFAIHGATPLCVSGTFKCYQFLTGEKLRGESVSCDGEVLQNTVYTPNHAYVACDVKQSAGAFGKKYNPKSTVNTQLDCYYPDNFNAYDVDAVDATSITLRYRKTAASPAMNLGAFRSLLTQDRANKLARGIGVVFHPEPEFSKRISLNGRTVSVEYFGVQAGHTVANEFSVDLYRAVMHGERTARTIPSGSRVDLSCSRGLTVQVEAVQNCAFNADTLEGSANRRLHRALTDCIEIETSAGGDFRYTVRL